MELHEANRILRSVKSVFAADGIKFPSNVETDGLMMLLNRIDCDKYLMPKIKHAKSVSRTSTTFKRLDGQIKFFRAIQSCKEHTTVHVSSASLMLLHKSVCGDLDDGAGKPRQTDYYENGNAHTSPSYIVGSIKAILSRMNDIEKSPTISKEDFAVYLTHYMRELIILHPFENDSNVTVRLFLMLFCRIKGFSLSYYRLPPSAIKQAECDAFVTDDVTPLYKIFTECLSYERTVSNKKPQIPKTRRELHKDQIAPLPDGMQPYKEPVEQYDDVTDKQALDKQNERTAISPRRRELKQRQVRSEKQNVDDVDINERTLRSQSRSYPITVEPIIPQDTDDESSTIQRQTNKQPPRKPKRQSDSDALKRAIKLQQKISRLNEQLTELAGSVDDD